MRAFLDFDRFDDAQREVHTALGTYPHDGELLSLAAWVEHFHGTPEETQRLARTTLAVQSDGWRAHVVLTESLLGQGNVAASAEIARRLLSYYPEHAGTHLNYAYALAHDTRGVGVPEGADHAELLTLHIEEALALEPENASHFARASTFMQMRGEFGRARDFIAEALALDPTNSSYITQSAGLDEHDRDAFAKLKGALALSPGDTQAAFVLHERAWHLFGYGVLVTLGILTGMVF